MKIRSRQLYQYLLHAGVLHGSDEAIRCARQAYRKQYKKNWKSQQRPRKEIRFTVTLKQFQSIKMKGCLYGLPHTTYARQLLLSSAETDGYFIPYREKLQKILQLVSMVAIAIATEKGSMEELSASLVQAETELLHYLQQSH